MLPKHPLGMRYGWVKLLITIIVAVFGVLTQFDVTVNQEVGGPDVKLIKSETGLVKTDRDGKLSKAECLGLEKHAGENWQLFIDTFGAPADGESAYRGEMLSYPLSDTSEPSMSCVLFFDYDDELESVTMDLWVNRDAPGNPFG